MSASRKLGTSDEPLSITKSDQENDWKEAMTKLLSHSPLLIQSTRRLKNASRSEIGSENRGGGSQYCAMDSNET